MTPACYRGTTYPRHQHQAHTPPCTQNFSHSPNTRLELHLQSVFPPRSSIPGNLQMSCNVLSRTCTGVDGPASLILLPWWSMRALTLPQAPPATKMSPTRSVPRWIRTVPTVPFFFVQAANRLRNIAMGVESPNHRCDRTSVGEVLQPTPKRASFPASRPSLRTPTRVGASFTKSKQACG